MTSPSLHIVLVADGEPFHGASPEESALGGSETALVQMARSLARRGHRVQVYCRCPQPGLYQGVTYHDRRGLVRACTEERFDALIVSRHYVALDLPLQAGLKVLWNHDILVKPQPLAQRLDQVDLCLVLSQYHAQDFLAKLPACGPKLAVTRNGLDLRLLDQAGQGVEPVAGRVAYVSRPERGLKLLLKYVWPRLHQALPHLSLTLCGYQVEPDSLKAGLKREYAEIQELVNATPGVEHLGSLAKADYYAHLASCECLLYPCTFQEISCLAVLEAQALGVPVLTSDDFALRESVPLAAMRVPGAPGSPEYLEVFTARALEMFAHPRPAQALAAQAQTLVRARHDWDLIAAEWEGLFLEHLGRRAGEQAAALAASLVVNGDRAAAASLLPAPLPPLPEPEQGPAPLDPDEPGLLRELARIAWQALAGAGRGATVGVISADQGRTARALAQLLAPTRVEEVEELDQPLATHALVVVRDRLERAEDPSQLLARVLAHCRPEGWLLLCVASGAWPLVGPGFLGRAHDLGQEEILSLLPGRRVELSFLGRGLVRLGPARMLAGRWLALAPALGPAPGRLDLEACLRRTRPAPPELLGEVRRAGLM